MGLKSSSPSCPPTMLDEMEDRRQRNKEKQVYPIYPWHHMCRAARETKEQTHKVLPLHEAPSERNNQSMRFNKPFSYQEIQRMRRIRETIQRTKKHILELLKVLLCFMTLLGRM